MAQSSLVKISRDFVNAYVDNTPVQIKVLDSFLAYVLLAAVTQFVYCALVGTFPFNSFLSGLLATIGVFVFTVSLRLQVTNSKDFNSRTVYQAFAEYIFACCVLFLAVLNFMG